MRLGKGWDRQKLGRRKHDHEFYLVGAFKGLKRKEDCGRMGKVP